MNDEILRLVTGVVVIFCLGFAVGLFAKSIIERNEVPDDQLQLWREVRHRLKAPCLHTKRITRVVESYVTCEATVEVCADCGKRLTEIKIDC